MHLNDVLSYLRELAPENTAMDGDPVGLLIEPASNEINSIIVCLDATSEVANIAVDKSVQLIVAHHPLIYHPLKRLEQADPISSISVKLVRNGIGLYAAHTNWDIASKGVNDTLAERLGLIDVAPLSGAPIARIGRLQNPMSPHDLIEHVNNSLACLGTNTLRHTPISHSRSQIDIVAVCGGAGSSLMPHAIESGAQAFVTSDVRHDQFIDAAERGILLIDAGHDATESPGMETLAGLLQTQFPKLNVHFNRNWR